MDEFRLKPLAGLTVATTGFAGSELPELRNWIDKLDGIYRPDMTQSTHLLIAKDVHGSSPKLEAARKWKIQIESRDYLNESWEEFQESLESEEQEGTYFDSASIFIGEGFHESLVEYLRKIIRLGGGMFMKNFDACVTHYVTAGAQPLPKDLEILGELKYNVKIVSSKWLSDCFVEKKLMDIESYCWDPDANKSTHQEEIEDVDVLKPKKSTKFFRNRCFVVDGFPEEESRILKSNIVEYGGTLGGQNATLVRPFKHRYQTTQKCATEFWIEKCIQESKLLELSDSILFQPTKISLPVPDFEKFVIGITGFSGIERIWIGRIVDCLGGSVTDYFSRKNTHLLVKDQGIQSAKSKKAEEWKIPKIQVEWLYQWLESDQKTNVSPVKQIDIGEDSLVPSLRVEQEPKPEFLMETSTKELDPLEQLLFNDQNRPPPSEIINSFKQITKTEPRKRTIHIEERNAPTVSLPRSVSYDDHDGLNEQNRMFGETNPKKKRVEAKVFMFTGLTVGDRQLIAREVPGLGGTCLNHDRWDATCTHLIVSNPQKTEKFLAACASGAWYFSFI
jgi:hypothetical protein